jgi:hypothetical protein
VAASLLLLSRPGCHLCHELRALVERLIRGTPIELVERNIEEDAALLRRYALLIPVLLSGDVEIARQRISEADLRARLRELGLQP